MFISKYNPEGYPDPTTHDALVNIEREKMAANLSALPRCPAFRPIVFICSPYADRPFENEQLAFRYCQFAIRHGCIPIAPHLYFPRFLDDTNPEERRLGLFMGQVMLTKCLEIWVFGEHITHGMECEIAKAESRNMTIRYFTEDMKEVNLS